MYALDTNTLIYYFKGMGEVATRLLAAPPSEISVPVIVLYELETGIAKSNAPEKRRALINAFLSATTLLPFGPAEARQAAGIRADLEKAGTPIGPYDILIAATALAANATLVTRNINEFSRIPGLSLEDWFQGV